MRVAVAAVLVVIASAIAGCSSANRPRGTTPTTNAKAGTSTTGAEGATPGSFSWSLDPDPHLALGGGPATTLTAVLAPSAGGPGWIAAGTRDTGSGSTTATVWTSPDANSWTPLALTGPGVPSEAGGAATWKTSTVVVGSVGSGTGRRAQVWVSQGAGSAFAAVAVTSTNDSPSSMDHVTVGNLGYFATGTVGGQPAVWYSTNGLQWSVSTTATRILGSSPGARVNALLATSNYVFAAGSVRDGAAVDAALWSTQDGINWRQVVPGQGAFSGGGNHVITGLAPLGTLPAGGGLLAVGGLESGGSWTPVSWISPDGVSWSQPAGDLPRAAGPAVVRAVAPVATLVGPSEFFATGGGPSNQHLWQSGDGVRWNEIQLPAGAAAADGWRATLVASNGTTTVVADGDPGQAHLLTAGPKGWAEPSSVPSMFGPVQPSADAVSLQSGKSGLELTVRVTQPPQAIGESTVSLITLASSDGVNWSAPLPAGAATAWPAGPLPDGWTALTRAASGWIAVGRGTSGAPPADGPQTSGLAIAWSSSDGTHWGHETTLDTKPGVAPESPLGACDAASVAVAVGETYQSSSVTAAAWYTTGGSEWKTADVSPTPGAGGGDEMLGCISTTTGFYAFGATAGTSGDAPALWTSDDGTRWTRGDGDIFGSGVPGPLSAMAASGSNWLAVASAGADPEPDGLPGAQGVALTAPEGEQLAVWTSNDAGNSWQRQDGSGAVWQGVEGALLEAAGFAGRNAVIAGQVGGRLVVWTGTPG